MHIAGLAHPFGYQGPRQALNTAKKAVLDVYTRVDFSASALKKDAHSTANHSGNSTGDF